MKKVFLQFAAFFVVAGIYLFVGGFLSQAKAGLRDGAFTTMGPYGYNPYNMGYQFQPTVSGTVTQLWCKGSGGGSSTVTVWNSSGAALGSASVTCNAGTWVGSGTVSIPLNASTTYYVTQYGSSAYYENTLALPFTANNIQIIQGAYNTGGNFFPNTTAGAYIYGFADITYSTAAACPCATTTSTSSPTYNSLTVNGTVNPASISTMYYGFRYGASPTYNSATLCQNLPSLVGWYAPAWTLNTPNAVSASIGGLSSGTTYYTCVIAYNYSSGVTYYSPTTVAGTTTAVPPPVANIYPAQVVDNTSAILPGSVNAYGSASTGYFRYGTNNPGGVCTNLATLTTNSSTGSSNGNLYPVTAQITGLTAGATYYYCLQTTTAVTAYSAVSSFVTAATASTGCELFPGSVLATSANSTTIAGYLGSSKLQGTRIYQATVNGWTAGAFHTAVNGKTGGTITIIKNAVNNKIFGGYNPQPWTSAGSYTQGAGAFLFSLSDGYKLAQINYADYQTLGSASYGPTWGGGHDLGMPNSTLNASGVHYTNAWVDFEYPSSKGPFTYLDGGGGSPSAYNFTPSEIEVWQLSVCTTPPPPPPTPVSVACPVSQMTKTVATSAVQSSLGPAATGSLSSPSSATTPNSVYAVANVNGANTYAPGIMATGFGFTIPSGATITGISAFAGYYTPGVSTASTGMASALTKNGTTATGSSGEAYSNHSSMAYYNLNSGGGGAVNYLWGTTWTSAEINAATFGVGYASASSNAAGAVGFYVDSFQITVCYAQGPTLSNTSVTVLNPTSATLPGTVNANGTSTTAWFRYNTTNAPGNTCNGIDSTWTGSVRAPATGGTVYADSTAHAYTQDITGLLSNTTYYFCAIAQDSLGTWGNNSSAPFSFMTPSPIYCTPSSQSTGINTLVNFGASGGDGTNYTWSVTGGSPSAGSGASFSTQFANPGSYMVRVTSAGITASCTVNVSAAPMGSNNCSGKTGIYCYVVAADRKSFVVWAQLENTKDPDTTQCLDLSAPDSSGKWNYCQRSE